jgi:eukaryotic-like serine/threonine-protein kinase
VSGIGAGTTLCDGRYRLDGVIGRGGMAIVWRATDLQLEREVAIKIISDVLASDPTFVARFEREARLAAALNHPNLVKVFDFSVDAERPLLVMEYVAGGTLAEARGQALDVDALARALLDAVAHIHAAGILHRDIKPANVLLDPGGSPRLTDFGIARGEETTGLTQTGQVLGTLRYIAPEVATGEPATARSDLYSLGVLLGEATGHRSEPLSRLLSRLTAQNPNDRPASAEEALAGLDPTRVLEPAAANNPTRQQGRGGGISRAQAVVGAVLLLAVLALVVIAGSGGDGDKLDVAPAKRVRPAPAGAPVDAQLDRLEQIVRAAPRKR